MFITHDMGVVAEIADRVVVLRHGECMEQGPVARILAQPKADYSKMLMAATPRLGSGSPSPLRNAAPVLEVKELRVQFPVRRGLLSGQHLDYHAVNDVSLTIGQGETLGLVGESGCGKSTLARAVLRLIEPAAGSIVLMGQPLIGLSPADLRASRAKAQMVFQDPYASLNPRLPVHDLVTEPALIHGIVDQQGRRALAIELLGKVGLEPAAVDRYAHQFSGGQRQRLCIARALSVRPSLIVADEPVSALDVSVARQVTDLMADLQAREKVAFLFISHDIAVVERVSHRIAVMYRGQIVEHGETRLVLGAPQHPYTQRLLAAVPTAKPGEQRRRAPPAPLAAAPLLLGPNQRPEALTLTELRPGHFAAQIKGVPFVPGYTRMTLQAQLQDAL